MGKKSSAPAPAAPDPVATAAAQTGTNISTAQANAILGNVNQVTPDGSLTYSQTGNRFVEDATGGQTYYRNANGDIRSSIPQVENPSYANPPTMPTIGASRGSDSSKGGSGLVPQSQQPQPSATMNEDGWTQTKGYYIPQYTATQTLSAAQQAIKDQSDAASLNLGKLANQQSGFLTDYLSRPVDLSTLPAAGDPSNIKAPTYQQFTGGPAMATTFGDGARAATSFGDAGGITRSYGSDFSADRQRVEDAMFARLNPQIERDRSAMETQLANQGIRVGSTAWSAAMSDFNRGVSDQRTSITLAGGQEQSRLADLDAQRAGFENAAQAQAYQQQMGRGQFANAGQAQNFAQDAALADFGNTAKQTMYGNEAAATEANNGLQDRERAAALDRFNADNTSRSTALSELFANRNQPLNEIAALMSGSQVQSPSFVNTNMPTIPTVDYAGLVQSNYQNQMAAWQQQQAAKTANRNSLLGGLFSLGASAIKVSDRRLKMDIVPIGTGPRGLGVYLYRYVWGGPVRVGVMAQDVARLLPEAVVRMANGFLAVDYEMVLRPEAS